MKEWMFDKSLRVLERMRASVYSMEDYQYIDNEKEGKNGANRAWGLYAFLLHPDQRNEEAIVNLFIEEIKSRENDNWGGTSDAVKIGAYLVSLYQKMEYIPLFIRAKNSNFDMHCAFDRDYILSNGVEKTLSYVNNNDLEWKDDFMYLYNGPDNTLTWNEEDIERWKGNVGKCMNKWYIEPVLGDYGFFHFFSCIGDTDTASEIVSQWEKQVKEWNEEQWIMFLEFYEELDQKDKIVKAQEALLSFDLENKQRIDIFYSLGDCYLNIEDFEKSWSRLYEGLICLEKMDNWYEESCVNNYTQIIVNIILKINDMDNVISKEAVQWLQTNFEKLDINSSETLTSSIKVFDLIGDKENKKLSRRRLDLVKLYNKKWKLKNKKSELKFQIEEIDDKLKKLKKKVKSLESKLK